MVGPFTLIKLPMFTASAIISLNCTYQRVRMEAY